MISSLLKELPLPEKWSSNVLAEHKLRVTRLNHRPGIPLELIYYQPKINLLHVYFIAEIDKINRTSTKGANSF